MTMTDTPYITSQTIEDYVLYITSPPDEDVEATSIGLWVRHEGMVEYPIVTNTDGLPIYMSADTAFYDDPPEPLSQTFYEELGVHILRMMEQGPTTIDDFWAFLPDDMNDGEGWAIYQILRWIGGTNAPMTFEIEELVVRSLEALDETEPVQDLSEDPIPVDEIVNALHGTHSSSVE